MKKHFLLFACLLLVNLLFAQSSTASNQLENTAEKLIKTDGNLTIGGYGEVHYNQILSQDTRYNGILDVHRIVMFLGYNFSSRTQFISEIEFEYAKELWVEQAFIQHKLNKYMNFQAGLMLIPMGIINMYHEPVTFNGVERPIIDNKIAPTTWREIGVGFNGTYLPLSIKYQLMVVNGPVSYDGTNGLMNGSRGIREGRQKGSKAYASSPNFAGRVDYFGIGRLSLGLSGYFGKSQSKLYDKMSKNDEALKLKADSSVVGISMLGFDARYQKGGFQARAQSYFTTITNTGQYNHFTQKNGVLNDLGSSMYGYYVEAGYNILHGVETTRTELVPFVRYQNYDTHFTVSDNIQMKDVYKEHILTTGMTLKINQGVVIKTDIDFAKSKAASLYTATFNAGVGVMF
ncbi:MAG: hypothetical protein Q7J05_07190 [Paludibacter sp.]|nr:hypothetical protein [Paludibacter sp.]